MSSASRTTVDAQVGFRLSPQQRQLWRCGGGEKVVGAVFVFAGSLDIQGLRSALEQIVADVEILRTRFVRSPGQRYPVQLISPEGSVDWDWADLRHLGTEEIAARREEIAARGKLAFDLEAEPSLRATLVAEGEDRHRLFLVLPALVADGYTLGRVAHRLAELLGIQAVSDDAAEELQYADFAAWHDELLSAKEHETDRDYWHDFRPSQVIGQRLSAQRRTAGEVAPAPRLELLGMPASAAWEGRLRALAERCEVGLVQVCLAGWSAMLQRFLGEAPWIGRVVSGRGDEELEGLLGPCARAVPFHIAGELDKSFVDLVAEVAELDAEAGEWSDFFTWETFLQHGRVEGDLAFFPFHFEVVEVPDTLDGEALSLRVAEVSGCLDRFVLKLCVRDDGEQLSAALHYDARFLDAAEVASLADSLDSLLAAAALDAEIPLAGLALLSPVARRRLLEEWNATASSYPDAWGVQRLFEERARRCTSETALVFGEREMSYGTLELRANRLAHTLRALGIGLEDPVGIALERSLEMVVALLAVLKSGGAFVVIDPELPAARRHRLLERSGARVLICQRAAETPAAWEGRILALEPEAVGLPDAPETPLAPLGGPDHLAYVVHTSGSTGEPKGVLVPHRGVVSYLDFVIRQYGLGVEDRVLQLASLSFDAAVRDLVGPLCAGARVVLVCNDEARDPHRLVATIERHRITALLAVVPTLLRAILAAAVGRSLPTVRTLLLSGERLYRADCWRAAEVFGPAVTLVNQYGPTECTMTSSFYRVEPGWSALGDPEEVVLIGRPIANARFYLLDRNLEPVPVGMVGDLYIGGVGLTRGYLHQPRLTAERFVPEPAGPQTGGRLYATGDRARYRADGQLVFLGRSDEQIKLRGYRIEPAEVEAVMRHHPAVRQVAVVARGEASELQLVAYPVLAAEGEEVLAALRSHLQEQLPLYMMPAAIVPLPVLPVLPNGKIDRRSLPAPEEVVRPQAEFVAPRSIAEELMAVIWSEVLGLDRVGIHDNFFELGGHSLLAAQVLARVREVFQVELPLQRIFEEPNLAELAEAVEEARQWGASSSAVVLEPQTRGAEIPLSYSQARLWFLAQLEPLNPAYNVPLAMRLLGRLDLALFEAALGALVERHEVLRTGFPAPEGRPGQQIHGRLSVRIPLLDLSALPAAVARAEARRLAMLEARAPFDLERPPLLRAHVVALAEAEHVALFTMHHIVSDEWSMAVLVRELTALVRAAGAGETPALQALPLQYADFAIWQRRHLSQERLAELLEFWRGQLAGAPAQLALPTDRRRAPGGRHRSAGRSRVLGGELMQSVRRAGRKPGATPFMVLLATFQVLLARYSGQRDLVVGVPVAGRSHLHLEPLIGFFVNTLALRADLRGAPTVAECLRRTRDITLKAFAHQALPFEVLVEHLDPERDLGRSPFFQAEFVWQNVPQEPLSLPGIRVEPFETGAAAAKFDLDFFLQEQGDGSLATVLRYDGQLFDAVTIERLLRHFEILLGALAARAEDGIADLALLSPAEGQQLAVEWNASGIALPAETTAHERFERRLAVWRESVAACHRDVAISYGELERRSRRVACGLLRAGLQAESLVALCCDRNLSFLVAMLGILRAGGTYLPLDPTHPPERLSQMLGRSAARFVLTAPDYRARLEALLAEQAPAPARLFEIEGLLDDLEPEAELQGPHPPNGLAYVLYTSGSTGVPKGAMVEQLGMLNHLQAKIHDLGLTAGDVVAQTASQTFDISVWQFLAALLVGGKTQIYGDDVAHHPARLTQAVLGDRVTVLETVPTILRLILDELEAPEATAQLPALRWMIPTGEALPPELCLRWLTLNPDVPLLNAFGPTECSDDVTHAVVASAAAAAGERVSIGRPVDNTRLYVLDHRLRPLPLGVSGELLVGGVGVGRGYLGDPRGTARAFVPDPFSAGGRLYRTGDRGRYLTNGDLDFLGRGDHQVKIRGQRIELGEIEAVLSQHPAVRESVVLLQQIETGARWLVACIVLATGDGSAQGGSDGLFATLRDFLRGRLPESMLPAHFVALESFPLTANGKVDRRALAQLEETRAVAGSSSAPLATWTEELLAGIWSEVLGVAGLGAQDDFFARGGHSLLATQLISRVQKVFQVDFPLRAIFEEPTLTGMASWIDRLSRGAEQSGAPALVPVPRDQALPLSFAQQRLWFLHQLDSASFTYNIPAAIRLRGRLRVELLESTLNEIVRRHEALRTRFESVAGEAFQIVDPPAVWSLPLIDLSALPAARGTVEARRLAVNQLERPFRLETDRLLRCFLLRRRPDEHDLVVVMHHIISDGWSMEIMVRELTTLYGQLAQGLRAPLRPLPIQIADYAVWQRQWLRGEVLEQQLDYWRRQLAGLPPVLALPLDRPWPAIRSQRGARHELFLERDFGQSLKSLARERQVTLFMVLLAAFEVLLYRYSNQEDFAVGTPTAGRTRLETEGLIGFLVNTLVLRADLAGSPDLGTVLRRTRDVALEAHRHQDLPFEKLVEELQPERGRGHSPLFQAMVVLQNVASESVFELPDLAIEPIELINETAKFELIATLAETPRGLVGSMLYSTDLFDPPTIERMAKHFVAVLRAMAAGALGHGASTLALLDEAERREVVSAWRERRAEHEPGECLHEIFALRARETPAAVAVVWRDEIWSYRELDEASDAIAHRLRRLGVGPEVVVGLCANRGLGMVAGILGILKAGGGYLPLRPDDPVRRRLEVLSDSGASVALVEGVVGAELAAVDPADRFDGVIEALEDALLETPRVEGARPAVSPRVAPEQPAYVIYTSGSTGTPKGVVITHHNVVRLFRAAERWFDFSPDDVWTLFHSYAFDFSVWEIWGALLYGGKLVVVPEMVSRSPQTMAQLLFREGVTVLNQTPSAFRQLIPAVAEGGTEHRLRWVVFGGEALELGTLAPWFERWGEQRPRLVNMYGITETTVHVTFRGLNAGDLVATSGRSVGMPLPDLEVFTLDRHLQLVPAGVVGEMYVAGAGLARCYLGHAALTASRFLPEPFSGDFGARLYCTGDLARRRRNGELEYAGRADHQVKIRGFRIELGEIEAALTSLPGILESVVLIHRMKSGDQSLVAYLVARPDTHLEPARLGELLRQRLPGYMVPAFFSQLDAFPLTGNGKLDRAALPAPEAAYESDDYVAPRSQLEHRMTEIWADSLGLERVSITDDFFAIGGDSIHVVRLVTRMNQELATTFHVADLFSHPTIRELVDQSGTAAARQTLQDMQRQGLEKLAAISRGLLEEAGDAAWPADWEDVYPLSGIEQGMVYYSLLMPEQPIYVDQNMYLLNLVDSARFCRVFEMLIKRHSILRSVFYIERFQMPMKVVLREPVSRWEVEDLSHLQAEERVKIIARFRRENLERGFSFEGELLWRLKIFRVEADLYCVAWLFHHAILDGWSNLSFWAEVNTLYGQDGVATLDALPQLRCDYKDYLAISLGRRSAPATQAFWQEYLAGHGRNALPFRRPRSAQAQRGSRRQRRSLPDALYARLSKAAQQHGVSLYSVCLSAYVYLHHVLTAEDDVLVGVVSHERPALEDGDKVLGCFLNTVPLRMDLSRPTTGLDLIQRVNAYLRLKKEHEVLLVEIQEMVGGREGDNPFFDTLFNFMDFHVLEGVERNEIFQPMSNLALWKQFDFEPEEMTNTLLDLEVTTTFDHFSFVIKYSPSHFWSEDIARAMDLYERVLEALGEGFAERLSSERLLTEAMRREVLTELNDTRRPYPDHLALHQLVDESLLTVGERPALVIAGQKLTYEALGTRVQTLAGHLGQLGIRRGDSVAVVFERSVELVVALLAVLRAGAAYVPLEPSYPAGRKGYILRQSGARWMLADRKYAVEEGPDEVRLVLPAVLPAATAGRAEPPSLQPNDLAYSTYTSGSTGRPKGVMIDHHAAVNLIHWVNRSFEVGAQSRILMLSSVCFDLSVYDLFGGLAARATVVIAEEEDLRDPDRLARLVSAEKITFWSSVPSTMGHLVRFLEETDPGYRQQELEVVLLSGDWIPLALPARIRRFFPGARVISLGGATEATVWSNFFPIGELDPTWVSIPYGRPIDNNTFYILDRRLDPVPPAVVGELYIGGSGVARGYAGEPAKTALSFLPDRFSRVPGARFYRTGDLGRMLACGNMEFLGRQDHQVKIRGFRIELGEIESVLMTHPDLREVAVIDRQDPSGERYLCAYVVSHVEVDPGLFKEHLRRQLPAYMIPQAWVRLSVLPLTGNGKLDRKALPDPGAESGPKADLVAPEGAVEQALVKIWQEVLGVGQIGVRQDFFSLGGHSLSAVQVVTRMRRLFGFGLSLREFFEHPTVAQLAALVTGKAEGAGAAPPIRRHEIRGQAPLSFSQERFWFLHELDPFSFLGAALLLRGTLDVAALARSFAEIVRRHEALRTIFREVDGRPMQFVQAASSEPLPVVDLSAVASHREELCRLATKEARTPFPDLGKGPLMRTRLLRLAADEHVLLVALHHIVADGWSMGLFFSEIGKLYGPFTRRLPSPLPEPAVQYTDFVYWQREWLDQERLDKELAYWRQKLAGPLPVLRLPTQKQRPATPRFKGARIRFELARELSLAFDRLKTSESVTPFITLLAAFKSLLYLYTGQGDVIVGTHVANRNHHDIEGVMGYFVNNLALRTSLSGELSFREALQRVRKTALEAYAHQDLPFEKLVEDLRPDRSAGVASIFQVLFVLQDVPGIARELPGLEIAPFEVEQSFTNFDLNLALAQGTEGFVGTLTYDTDLFDHGAMERLAQHFTRLVESVMEDPDLPLSEIELVSHEESKKLVDAFSERF